VAGAMQVAYVGFSVRGAAREYTLRVRLASGDSRDFVLAIPNAAFLAHHVRYQDAPELCFLKLQRELIACGDAELTADVTITEDDLEQYRVSHAPKPAQRRPKVPPRPLDGR
jgi:hypothetical protein